MSSARAVALLQESGLRIFTTSEAAALWRSNRKAAAEMLRRLSVAGLVRRLRRGLWTFGRVDPLEAVERLAEPDVAYVSLLTALRHRGLIEQIPAVIYVATTGRARRLRTSLATFSFHHVPPVLFGGITRERGIPIATAEKALADTLYLGASRARVFSRLPEVELPRGFSIAETRRWLDRVPSPRLRTSALRRLDDLLRARTRR